MLQDWFLPKQTYIHKKETKMVISRRFSLVAVAAALAGWSAMAHAEPAYPAKPITMVVMPVS